MKKILWFIIILSPFFIEAKTNYKKFIEEHDISQTTKYLEYENSFDFWNHHVNTDPKHLKFLNDIMKDKGAEREALKNYISMPIFIPQIEPSVMQDCEDWIESVKYNVGDSENIEVCIINDDSFNAFTAIGKNGFVIGINRGVFDMEEMTTEMINGVIAHEYAHAVMFHIIKSEYAKAKRKRRNDLMGGIAQGLNILAAGVDAYAAGVMGTQPNTNVYIDEIKRIEDSKKLDLYKYYYSFGREAELEADLLAYRFLEWSGDGGENYLKVLKIIRSIEKENKFYRSPDKESDHPSTEERIELIEYAIAHPELGRKK